MAAYGETCREHAIKQLERFMAFDLSPDRRSPRTTSWEIRAHETDQA